MTCAKNTAKRNDDSVEEARAQPHSRSWLRLHISTWVSAAVATVVLTLIVIPGRANNHGAFTGALLFQEHGWPFVFLDRVAPEFGAGNLSDAEEFFSSQHLNEGVRWASFPDTLDMIVFSFKESGPSWLETANWSFSGTFWVCKLGLVLDLLTALGIVAAVAAVYEWWRRRHWQYSLRCLLAATLVISAMLGWSVRGHQLESRAAADLQNKGLEVSVQCIAPVWLKMLIGENHLPTFVHVMCITAPDMKPAPENMDRYKQAVAVMADNAKHLRWLQHLFLDSLPVTDADLKDVEAWTELAVLCLDGTQVTDAGLEYIHDLPRLRFLSLDDTRVTGTGLQFLQELPQLQDLSLDDAPVADAALCHLKVLPQLRDLSLNGTKVTDAGLQYLAGLTNLKTIRLDHTVITDNGLLQLERLSQLEQLQLRDTKVTDAGIERLQQVLPKCEVDR